MNADLQNLPLMQSEERAVSALSHLSTAIPLWALVSNALIFFLYREKSRAVCFHARQGLHFQVLLIVIYDIKCLAYMLAKILSILLRRVAVAERVDQWGNAVVLSIFIVYVAFCMVGAIQAARGKILPYPFVSRRALRRYIEVERGEI